MAARLIWLQGGAGGQDSLPPWEVEVRKVGTGAGAMGIPQGRAPGQRPHFSPSFISQSLLILSISAKEFPRHLWLPATLGFQPILMASG